MTGKETFRSTVLVLHTGALGDCVLTLHLTDALKRIWGGPRITLAARSPIARWASRHGLIDEALSLEDLGAHLWYQADTDVSRESTQLLRGSDWVVSFLGGAGDAVSARLSALCTGKVLSIDPKAAAEPPVSQMHIAQQWAARLAECGVAVSIEVPSGLCLDEAVQAELRARLARRLGGSPDRIAICHPGSGGRRKCCRIDALEELIGILQSRGWTVCWMIGPDEVERDGSSFLKRLESTAPAIFEESVEVAADLAAGAAAYIGHDAGMTHVAALAGVPTIAVFGPTDPLVWRPLGKRCTVVQFPGSDGPVESWVRTMVSLVEST